MTPVRLIAAKGLSPFSDKEILGSTAQFGKKSQTGFLPQFKRKKWGKKTAETRRRNCAVVPLIFLPSAGGKLCAASLTHLS